MQAFAQAPEGRQQRGTAETQTAKEDQGTPIPPETNSVTKHDWTAGGQDDSLHGDRGKSVDPG